MPLLIAGGVVTGRYAQAVIVRVAAGIYRSVVGEVVER
jgi:hypothetical protein